MQLLSKLRARFTRIKDEDLVSLPRLDDDRTKFFNDVQRERSYQQARPLSREEQETFTGPPPNSPEGIEAARVANEKRLRELATTAADALDNQMSPSNYTRQPKAPATKAVMEADELPLVARIKDIDIP